MEKKHSKGFPPCLPPRVAPGHSLVTARQPPGRSCPPPAAALCLDLDGIKHHPCGTEKEKQTKCKENGDRKKKKKVNRACMPTFPLPETGPSSCGRTVSKAISHLLLPKPVFVPPNLSAAPSPGPAQLVVAAGRVGQPSQGGRLGFCLAHKQLGRVSPAVQSLGAAEVVFRGKAQPDSGTEQKEKAQGWCPAPLQEPVHKNRMLVCRQPCRNTLPSWPQNQKAKFSQWSPQGMAMSLVQVFLIKGTLFQLI